MQQAKEYTLNGVLAILVVLSIVLSYRVWFPPDQGALWRAKEAHVQVSPPSAPEIDIEEEIYRPEHIYVRNREGQIALLPAGSLSYLRVWDGVKDVLSGLQPISGPQPSEEQVDRNGESITVALPIPLMLNQWSRLWGWGVDGLPNFTLMVDRVTIYMSKTPMIYFSGATGNVYRIGALSELHQKILKGVLGEVEPGLFQKYRPVVFKEPSAKLASGLLVPDITEMPEGTLTVTKPDAAVEQARYFPDLSVVRHIEERDANSYTDGLRWLRLTFSGQLEYVTASTTGTPPDLARAQNIAKAWVPAHGGWPSDLVLSGYMQQVGRSVLIFNLRLDGGRFPVETANGAMRLEVTTNREQPGVLQYRRYPTLKPLFTRIRVRVIPAEKVLQDAVELFPSLFLFQGEVREMHLGYLIRQPDKPTTWKLEPVWVIQVGEKRVYAPASPSSQMKPFIADA